MYYHRMTVSAMPTPSAKVDLKRPPPFPKEFRQARHTHRYHDRHHPSLNSELAYLFFSLLLEAMLEVLLLVSDVTACEPAPHA